MDKRDLPELRIEILESVNEASEKVLGREYLTGSIFPYRNAAVLSKCISPNTAINQYLPYTFLRDIIS